jgi:hypothetical protein
MYRKSREPEQHLAGQLIPLNSATHSCIQLAVLLPTVCIARAQKSPLRAVGLPVQQDSGAFTL